ncbi:unnamed protein product [Brachionus calyciflorus]|uniref:Calcineurin-like phosphoesterase domain-containing protein n=1 Tax=Brachionus calyciflorus TaxID=104777 RepID=A0A813WND9_9BILA|nr:unnamed protein product [Brachionus calyciflorus]
MFKTFTNLFKPSKMSIIPIPCEELSTEIKVNSNTNNPDAAWNVLKEIIPKNCYNQLPLDTPVYENKVRFVCISDTHSKIDRMHHEIPSGDILIHAGDFTNSGSIDDVIKFSNFLKTLDHKFTHKIIIAGNHELSFDKTKNNKMLGFFDKNKINDQRDPRDFLENCIYLEESMVEIYGIKIYGAPWQPTFGGWAFNVDRGEPILKKWNKIPDNCDVLITHGPPLGFGDKVNGGYHVGCCELLTTIRERVRPKYHIFGHIHEDHGAWTDGQTTYLNPSICNFRYVPSNPPILFDIDLPEEGMK